MTHYSYFGSFRASASNVGPNAAMLDDNGRLTSIGAWYLGGVAAGTTGSSAAAAAVYASAGWMLLVGVVCLVAAW